MKKSLLLLIITFSLLNITHAQSYKVIGGDPFEFNSEKELKPQFIFVDEYNHYLISAVEVSGMLSENKIIIRKFDQTNQLLETFTQDFPKIDENTIYYYLDSYEIDQNKVISLIRCHSGKAKKSEVHAIVFDKKSASFTTTQLMSIPIISAMKSGDVSVSISENRQYIAINYLAPKAKNEPRQNKIIVKTTSSLSTSWEKDNFFEEKYTNRFFKVTNSGKAILVRSAEGMSLDNYLMIFSKENDETQKFSENIYLQEPNIISVKGKEYLLAFNYPSKGLRASDYEKLLFYDIEMGEIVHNHKISFYNSIPSIDIKEVCVRDIFIQNGEIRIFTEAKVRAGTRQEKTSPHSSTTMEVPYYKFGPACEIILNFEGELMEVVKINVAGNALADLYYSYGVTDVKGEYYILNGHPSMIYNLKTGTEILNKEERYKIEYSGHSASGTIVNQLFFYTPDSKKFVLAKTISKDKMSLISAFLFD